MDTRIFLNAKHAGNGFNLICVISFPNVPDLEFLGLLKFVIMPVIMYLHRSCFLELHAYYYEITIFYANVIAIF